MGKLFSYGLAAAICACFLVAVPLESASAHSPEDAIKVRRAMMKENNGHFKAFKKFFKGGKTKKEIARAGTAGDMELRAHAISHIATEFIRLFPKGSSTKDFPGKTRAKPAIWEQKDDFRAKGRNLRTLALLVEKAAADGDKAAIKAAYAKMGKLGCGGCHKNFRAAKKKKK